MLAAAYPQQDTATAEGDAPAAADASDADDSPVTTRGHDAGVPVAPEDAPSVPSNMGPVVSSAVIQLGIEGRISVTMKRSKAGSGDQRGHAQRNAGRRCQRSGRAADRASHQRDADSVTGQPSEWSTGSSCHSSRWQVDLPLPATQADLIMARIKRR